MKQLMHFMIASMMLICLVIASAAARHSSDGETIHQAAVNNHELTYELIDMRQALKEHGSDSEATHHLMVFIRDQNGDAVTGAKTGFLIQGPDGKQQRVMAMGMADGYGADVSLDPPGTYTIRTKAVAGGKTLLHSFDHVVQ
ncbi:MAG: hypothetical protein K9K81_02565 [Desulfobacteraceae bacterium]|nr:hypothetical protein [Desulfobacteraceae bacterium]